MNKQIVTLIGLGLTPSTGGPSKTISLFKDALNANVVSFTDFNVLKKEGSSIPNTEHIEIDSYFFGKYFYWSRKKNTICAEKIVSSSDLISCHIIWRYSSFWTYYLSNKYSIPYWVVLHGSLDPYVFTYRGLIKKIWFKFFGRKFLKNASKVICSTSYELDRVKSVYTGENLVQIYWPIQKIDMSQKTSIKTSLKLELGIDLNDRVLIFIGRFHYIKRPLETIQAFISSKVNNVTLIMVGPYESYQHEELISYIQKNNGNKNNIKIVGPAYGAHKDNLIILSDALISMSLKENYGHVVAESISAGNPVILSPGNALAHDLKAIDCGWMLNDNSISSASKAIKEFSDATSEEISKMGNKGKIWANKNLSPQIFDEKINNLAYDSLNFTNAD